MLEIIVSGQEFYDDSKEEFIQTKDQKLLLEHSLISLSKWEAAHQKPFLARNVEKTDEELIDYIRCMTLTHNVNPLVYRFLTPENVKEISDYINSPMTATWFSEAKVKAKSPVKSRETPTSELIYYWMIACNIPMECERWHLNRLLTLIRVCSVKNSNGKMSKKDQLAYNRELNKARRAQLKTTG